MDEDKIRKKRRTREKATMNEEKRKINNKMGDETIDRDE